MDELWRRLNPATRIRLAFSRELAIDKDGEDFTAARYHSYLDMLREANKKQENSARTVAVLDIVLAIFVNGGNVPIPGIGATLAQLPVAQTTLAIVSSFAFLLLGIAFLNAQLYVGITQVYAKERIMKSRDLDPDFLTASDAFTELWLKSTRPKMNTSGVDFFTPGLAYKLVYGSVYSLSVIAIIAIGAMHFSLCIYSVWPEGNITWYSVAAISAVALLNFSGMILIWSPSLPVKDEVYGYAKRTSSQNSDSAPSDPKDY